MAQTKRKGMPGVKQNGGPGKYHHYREKFMVYTSSQDMEAGKLEGFAKKGTERSC